jgi:15-cis-phytoene synthase
MSKRNAPSLEQSMEYCEQLTRRAAKNFYYGLKLLPQPRRGAMYAIYAYMRALDDIADEQDGRPEEQRLNELELWQRQTHAAFEGEVMDGAAEQLWPAFSETVQHYRVPMAVFDDAIEGQRQDLRPVRFATFDELGKYCYRVAGVVGLASIYIWGFEGGADTERLAVDRGIAFQLTNILRDLREDAARGRIYLPRDEMAAHGVTEDDIFSGRGDERFQSLMKLQIARAREYYARSAPLEQRIEETSRPTLATMTDIYHALLERIASDPQRVLRQRVSLSISTKLKFMWKAIRAK